MTNTSEKPSYHDLYVTTSEIERIRIFDLPYGYEVTCNRVAGWTLWFKDKEVAGEYGEGLLLDVAGHVICNSLTERLK
jgi:hypothetical protein